MRRSSIIGNIVDASLDSYFGKGKKKKKPPTDVSVKGPVKTEPTARALAVGAGLGAGTAAADYGIGLFTNTLFNGITKTLGALGFTLGSFITAALDIRSANKERRRREAEVKKFADMEDRAGNVKYWYDTEHQALQNYIGATGSVPDWGYSKSVEDAIIDGSLNEKLIQYVDKGSVLDLGYNPYAPAPVEFGHKQSFIDGSLTEHGLKVESGEVRDGYDYVNDKINQEKNS